jgi:hypothetical protein
MEPALFPCTYKNCEKTYTTKCNLNRHIKAFHDEIKMHLCEICDKKLSSKQNLKEHKFKHFGIKPYPCTYQDCKAKFRQRSQLYVHMKFHLQVNKMLAPQDLVFHGEIGFFTKVLHTSMDPKLDTIMKGPYTTSQATLPPINPSIN